MAVTAFFGWCRSRFFPWLNLVSRVGSVVHWPCPVVGSSIVPDWSWGSVAIVAIVVIVGVIQGSTLFWVGVIGSLISRSSCPADVEGPVDVTDYNAHTTAYNTP
jgi:hypothetical protein